MWFAFFHRPTSKTFVFAIVQQEQDLANFLDDNAVQGKRPNISVAKAQALWLSNGFILCLQEKVGLISTLVTSQKEGDLPVWFKN